MTEVARGNVLLLVIVVTAFIAWVQLAKPVHEVRRPGYVKRTPIFREVRSCSRIGDAHGPHEVVLLGLAKHLSEINDNTIAELRELNCNHGVVVDVLASAIDGFERICAATHERCALLRVVTESMTMAGMTNRVDLLTHARTRHRQDVAEIYNGVQVVTSIDLDLARIPPVEQIMRNARAIIADPTHPGAVCALGLDFNHLGDDYYDTYATVLREGTFVYPLFGREHADSAVPGEDPALVVSEEPLGDFTQWDLTRYIQHKAREAGGYLGVQSCYGGTAVYRASAYLSPTCGYELVQEIDAKPLEAADDLRVFNDRWIHRPCEHVVFHKCLRETHGVSVAIDPLLVTWWKNSPERRAKTSLVTNGREVPAFQNAVATLIPNVAGARLDAEERLLLVNGVHVVKITPAGKLVVEHSATGRVVWSPPESEFIRPPQAEWERMFLVLGPNGDLRLLQQVARHSGIPSDACEPNQGIAEQHCRLLLWRTRAVAHGQYRLALTGYGALEAQFMNGITYWSSAWDPRDNFGKYHTVYMTTTLSGETTP